MISYSSRFLRRGEVWFDEDPGDLRSVDWILYNHRSQPVPGARWRHFHNYQVDLTLGIEELWFRLNKDTAYKIRRARERDRVVCEARNPSDPAVLDRFEAMYNPFAARRGLSPLDRKRFDRLAASGSLDITVACDSEGNELVSHANYRGAHRATQLYTPSLQQAEKQVRNRVSRANRFLIWHNLERYREQGLSCYDFGGWYPGTTDRALLNINDFKRGFGGEVMREFQCEQIVTLKGWLVLRAAEWLKRWNVFPLREKARAAGEPAQAPATA